MEASSMTETTRMSMPSFSSQKRKYLLLGIVAVVLLGLLLYRNASWFVVAMVNGQPITRLSFEQKIVKRFGANTLDSMIGETLIAQEAAKKGITVSDQQINGAIEKTKKTLPQGMKLEDALAFQGLSEVDFRSQLRIKMFVDQLLSDQATISAKEVDAYIAQNKQTLPATDEAALKMEAQKAVHEQKTQELFQGWYQNLLQSAGVKRFL